MFLVQAFSFEMLSDREQYAADLIAAFGLTNKQIALAMGISWMTARLYVRRIMEKQGLSSRLDIVKWRLSRGNE